MSKLVGRVPTGFGLASSSFAGFFDELSRLTGISLLLGTLNLELRSEFEFTPQGTLPRAVGNGYEDLHYHACQLSSRDEPTIPAVPALIVRTSTQAERRSKHSLRVLEIAAPVRLREKLRRRDRSWVKVVLTAMPRSGA